VAAAGPDTDVIMTSDHGFGATTEIVYINEWLSREGYLQWATSAEQDETGKLTANKIKDHLSMIDWKNTVAFCPTPSSNAIYIKKDNNSGHGVKDGDYLEFCLKLKQELLSLRDPRNGKPIIAGVDLLKLEGKPFIEPSPDIHLRLRDGGFVSILKSQEIVVPRKHADGTHRPNGIFIGRGPHLQPGIQVRPLNLLDITPLMLYLLGLPVPDDLEGEVPAAVLRDEALTTQAVTRKSTTLAPDVPAGSDREATPEEREALMKQLQLLGYMD